MRNTLHFITMIDHRIVGGVAIVFSSAFAKIYIARQLSEEQNVSSSQYFRFDAGCAEQFIEQLNRAQIRIEPKFLPHLKQSLFRTYFQCGVVVVLGMTYGTKEDGISLSHGCEAFLRQGFACSLDCLMTDRCVVVLKLMAERLRDMIEYILSAGCYLFANPVAGYYCYAFLHRLLNHECVSS